MEIFPKVTKIPCIEAPKTAWMRVVSNAVAKVDDPSGNKKFFGFELGGIASTNKSATKLDDRYDSFERMYGFDQDTGQGVGKTFMGWGYDSTDGGQKVPHMVEEMDFKHRPYWYKFN